MLRRGEVPTGSVGSAPEQTIRAFQTEGESASGAPCAWKLFRLDRIESVELLDATFAGPRPRFRRRDRAMKGRTVGLRARDASAAVRAAP